MQDLGGGDRLSPRLIGSHLIARFNPDREQRQVQGGRAGGDGEHVLGLDVLGKPASACSFMLVAG